MQLVSVIIPFYNAGKWLEQAIEGVLQQTYTNWEIILVDDGSLTEDTEIAKSYASKYPESIFYVQHEDHKNLGLTVSRNVGIRHSKGDIIAFLDADDFWLPQKLQHQLEIFNRFPIVSVICEASIFWYSWKDEDASDELIEIGVPQGIYDPPQLMKQLYPLGIGQPPCPSGIVIKRDAFERSGGFEERFSGIYQLYEDQAFLSKVYSKETIFISAIANNFYRKRPDSMAAAANDEQLYNKVRLFYATFLEDYFFNKPRVSKDVQQLIEAFKLKLTSS